MSDVEIWLPIPFPGYEGWYEASSFGRVRRSMEHGKGLRGWNQRPRKIQARPPSTSQLSKNRPVRLRPKLVLLFNHKRYSAEVGHLVAMAFHGLPPAGHQADHIDSDPWNNRPENLEWVTRLENMRRAHRNGILNLPRGEEHRDAKLTVEQVREIRVSTEPTRVLVSRYGIGRTQVKNIRARRSWKHVA